MRAAERRSKVDPPVGEAFAHAVELLRRGRLGKDGRHADRRRPVADHAFGFGGLRGRKDAPRLTVGFDDLALGFGDLSDRVAEVFGMVEVDLG